MLLGATTESKMEDILKIEENSQNGVWPTGNEFACCQGQQMVSNMADKHEIEDNTPRGSSRQEVEFLPKVHLRDPLKANKQIMKQIQHADLNPIHANLDLYREIDCN